MIYDMISLAYLLKMDELNILTHMEECYILNSSKIVIQRLCRNRYHLWEIIFKNIMKTCLKRLSMSMNMVRNIGVRENYKGFWNIRSGEDFMT